MAVLEFEKPLVELEARIEELRSMSGRDEAIERQLEELEVRVEELQHDIYRRLTVWQKVQLSRHPDRPYFLDYLERLFEDFVELHGDRAYGDDPAVVAGLATFEGRSVAVIGHQKGRTTKEKVRRNFGMAHPEGYRKACRVMELAARFGRPVLTFIDTPGAYPGIGAEERGQAQAIGQSLLTMAGLGVPVVATVIGEGGSGGALAFGVANRVLMLQYATYSIISPEGCASILWRDGTKAPDAAEQLHLLAEDVARLEVADAVVPEPVGGAHRDPDGAAAHLREALRSHLEELEAMSSEALLDHRYRRFRGIGAFRSAPVS
ncbi:MAG: acetyl-CoA carboxylase carboxyltransferase subunit alpha [Myxococcota bacterium]